MELAEAPAEPGAAELPSRLEPAPAAAAAAEPEEEPEEEDDEPDAKRRAADIFLRGGPKKELAPGQARRPAASAQPPRPRSPAPSSQLFSTLEDLPTLRARLDALQSAWQLEHSLSARWVSYAVWPVGSPTAEILLKRGKGWNAFGTHLGPRTLLHAEEALYLMESDRLVVYRSAADAAPISLHAGYASALAAGVSAERYAAFAHLCRLGFVVHRHGTPWFLDSRSAEAEAPAAPGEAEEAEEAPPLPSVEELGAAQQESPVPEPAPVAAPSPHDVQPPSEPSSRAWWRSDVWPASAPPSAQLVVEPPPGAAEAASLAWRPQLLYDVWPPQSVFTKRRVGKPFFRVCLSTSRPPSAAETADLAARSGAVPVKCIIVRPGIVIGFDVGVVSLTTVPKKKGNR